MQGSIPAVCIVSGPLQLPKPNLAKHCTQWQAPVQHKDPQQEWWKVEQLHCRADCGVPVTRLAPVSMRKAGRNCLRLMATQQTLLGRLAMSDKPPEASSNTKCTHRCDYHHTATDLVQILLEHFTNTVECGITGAL